MGGVSPLLGLEPVLFTERVHRLTVYTLFEGTSSPDGKHIYAGSLYDDAVAVFSRNSTTGALTFVEFHKDKVGGVDGLDGVESVTVSPDGKNLYAAATTGDAVAVFSVVSGVGASVPSVSQWGLIAMAILMAALLLKSISAHRKGY